MFSSDFRFRNAKSSGKKFEYRIFSCLILLLCLSISGIEANSNNWVLVGDWSIRSPSDAPPAIFSPELAYDNESDRIVLFSGAISPFVAYNGTWAFDKNTNTWENLTTSNRPGGRIASAMVYDEESDRVILFGGIQEFHEDLSIVDWGDTWAYNYNINTWENMTPEVSPACCSSHNMAYDSESDRVILFGGSWNDPTAPSGRCALNETWAYDYNSNIWVNMNPVTSPGNLYAFGMTYDNESDRVILFGGNFLNNSYSTIKHDTWAYDFNSNNWTQMNPPEHPNARERFEMTYNPRYDRVILFGGDAGSETTIYEDTWIYNYNSNNWTELHLEGRDDHPSKRYYFDLAYDYESDQVILFGGCVDQFDEVLNETWSLLMYYSGSLPLPTAWPLFIDPLHVLVATGSIAVGLIVMVMFLRKRE